MSSSDATQSKERERERCGARGSPEVVVEGTRAKDHVDDMATHIVRQRMERTVYCIHLCYLQANTANNRHLLAKKGKIDVLYHQQSHSINNSNNSLCLCASLISFELLISIV